MNIKTLIGVLSVIAGALTSVGDLGTLPHNVSVALIAVGGAILTVDHYVTTLVKARNPSAPKLSGMEAMAAKMLAQMQGDLGHVATPSVKVITTPNPTNESDVA